MYAEYAYSIINAAMLYLKQKELLKFSLLLQNYLHEKRYDSHIVTGNISLLLL